MTCPGYVEGFIDRNYQYQGMLGKDALFCLCGQQLDKLEGVRVVVDFHGTMSQSWEKVKPILLLPHSRQSTPLFH